MKPSIVSRFVLSLTFALAVTGMGATAQAMGDRAQIFETPVDAGIWDHGTEFYLVFDLAEIGGYANQTGVWAGFHQVRGARFRGEIVLDQFGRNEVRFNARAQLIHQTAQARYFLVEVLDASGAVIKEFLVKGAALR